jgi:hypothetical protein
MAKNLVKGKTIYIDSGEVRISAVDPQPRIGSCSVEPVRPVSIKIDVFDSYRELGVGTDEAADNRLIFCGAFFDRCSDLVWRYLLFDYSECTFGIRAPINS